VVERGVVEVSELQVGLRQDAVAGEARLGGCQDVPDCETVGFGNDSH